MALERLISALPGISFEVPWPELPYARGFQVESQTEIEQKSALNFDAFRGNMNHHVIAPAVFTYSFATQNISGNIDLQTHGEFKLIDIVHPEKEIENQSADLDEATKPFVQFDQAALFRLLLTLGATEFKVFMFLTLRAYGWDEKVRSVGDGTSRAAATFVAKGTNLSDSTAETCIAKLRQKKLISKNNHSCKWGNTYQVTPLLLRQPTDDKSPPDTKKKLPKIKGPKIEGPKNKAPSSQENKDLGPQNLGTSIDPRCSDLSLKLSQTFENYFSKIRAPKAEEKERSLWAQIQYKNPDVTSEEFLECFNLVSKAKDKKGQPISMKILWMSNGFDTILMDARKGIRIKKREEEDRQLKAAKAKEEEALAQQVSPADVELAKSLVSRAFSSFSPIKPMNTAPSDQSITARRAFLLAQARQLGMATSARL